jgi:putative ABC transport system permease protein
MLRIALKMLLGDRAKYVGLIFGITFTSFLVTFAASYFAGIMTRGYAPIAENSTVDVWVMDSAVTSVEQTTNMSLQALVRVRSVAGVQSAVPLMFATADVRFPDGRYQPFQVVGVDDATLIGMPSIQNDVMPDLLRVPDAVVIDAGELAVSWKPHCKFQINHHMAHWILMRQPANWQKVMNYSSMITACGFLVNRKGFPDSHRVPCYI